MVELGGGTGSRLAEELQLRFSGLQVCSQLVGEVLSSRLFSRQLGVELRLCNTHVFVLAAQRSVHRLSVASRPFFHIKKLALKFGFQNKSGVAELDLGGDAGLFDASLKTLFQKSLLLPVPPKHVVYTAVQHVVRRVHQPAVQRVLKLPPAVHEVHYFNYCLVEEFIDDFYGSTPAVDGIDDFFCDGPP